MIKTIYRFLKEEDGLGTVEIMIIIAVLVGVALLFRKQLIGFVNDIVTRLFPSAEMLENNTITQPTLRP